MVVCSIPRKEATPHTNKHPSRSGNTSLNFILREFIYETFVVQHFCLRKSKDTQQIIESIKLSYTEKLKKVCTCYKYVTEKRK